MRKVSLAQRIACAALLIATHAHAAGVYVIAGPNTQLSAAEVREVFLGEKQFGGPTRLVPVDNAAAQGAFLRGVMKMEAAKYSATWVKKSFREAINPPPVKLSDAEVIEFVRRTPGAVGYVSKPPAGVSVVQEF
jgi:hypothetical protein